MKSNTFTRNTGQKVNVRKTRQANKVTFATKTVIETDTTAIPTRYM